MDDILFTYIFHILTIKINQMSVNIPVPWILWDLVTSLFCYGRYTSQTFLLLLLHLTVICFQFLISTFLISLSNPSQTVHLIPFTHILIISPLHLIHVPYILWLVFHLTLLISSCIFLFRLVHVLLYMSSFFIFNLPYYSCYHYIIVPNSLFHFIRFVHSLTVPHSPFLPDWYHMYNLTTFTAPESFFVHLLYHLTIHCFTSFVFHVSGREWFPCWVWDWIQHGRSVVILL